MSIASLGASATTALSHALGQKHAQSRSRRAAWPTCWPS